MMRMGKRGLLAAFVLLASAVRADLRISEGRLEASEAGGRVYFASGESGLWSLRFEGGRVVTATQVAAGCDGGRFAETRDGDRVFSTWTSPFADVRVVTKLMKDGSLALQADVAAKTGVVEEIAFPANLRFAASDVARFVYPGRGNETTGLAFNEKFFVGQHRYRVPYPPLFADWARLETKGGASVQVYGVQRRGGFEPWKAPTPFVPGVSAVGGDVRGGFYTRSSALWVEAGQNARTPVVRIVEGETVDTSLAAYLRENGLGRTLASKAACHGDSAFLRKLAASPLFLVYPGTAVQIEAAARVMPMPTLVHVHDYMPHGFDRGYPDFWPPKPQFGTEDEVRRMVETIHRRGGLFMPYTNPCWWGDEPKSAAFKQAGTAPLLRKRDGSFMAFVYGPRNKGYNITYWHPAVQAANRETRRVFRDVCGADILFQDQCGSLPWYRDFSPFSPSPTAHEEGMISIVEEDSRHMPLFTEDGFDRVADSELGLTGCAWKTVPLVDMVGRKLFKAGDFPADTFSFEPIAQRMFRDKLLFYHHDLAGFTKNERVLAWVLALGYNIVVAYSADRIQQDAATVKWYEWLHVIQSRVLAKTVGGRVSEFRHDRSPLFARGIDPSTPLDDGTIVATYGGVRFVVNLGDVPRVVEGHRLAPYGWRIEGCGVNAAAREGEAPFVEVDGKRFEYGKE